MKQPRKGTAMWSIREDHVLREHYNRSSSPSDIAARLGRTRAQVRNRARVLGLVRSADTLADDPLSLGEDARGAIICDPDGIGRAAGGFVVVGAPRG